ncbi:MAG: tRNA dihydrouridine synthase DusB [Burkholderiales bacterium]|nr:tRNA dihydrouridine synthase DusB [Burkholderiales bacterium]
MQLGVHALAGRLFAAPMAGVSDLPFRRIARRYGAALATTEMVSARPELRATRKSRLRRAHEGEPRPVSVQIVGADPATMADAARMNVDEGADLIDINMGCPAKKVCNVAAGSALLADEPLVARILAAVVAAVPVPVTLKIRTGPSPERRNAVRIARIAEEAGVRMLVVHGRTRACGFRGAAEYDTIAAVKGAVRIPVIANGDIDSADKARAVLAHTGADGLMIGRAACGRPWIFREIAQALDAGEAPAPPTLAEMRAVVCEHLEGLYALYGEAAGVRIARKHIGWYVRELPGGEALRRLACASESARAQLAAVRRYFDALEQGEDRAWRQAA